MTRRVLGALLKQLPRSTESLKLFGKRPRNVIKEQLPTRERSRRKAAKPLRIITVECGRTIHLESIVVHCGSCCRIVFAGGVLHVGNLLVMPGARLETKRASASQLRTLFENLDAQPGCVLVSD
jgi:hypothetical protein